MWSPIIFIALSQVFNSVSALTIQCGDRIFNNEEVQNAAENACLLWGSQNSCKNNLSKLSVTLNEMAKPLVKLLKQECPTAMGGFATSYNGNSFPPGYGPYISWHLTSFQRVFRAISFDKNLSMYRVIVRYGKDICQPVGAIIVRKEVEVGLCENLEGNWVPMDAGGQFEGARTFQIAPGQNNPASHYPMYQRPAYIDPSSQISTNPPENSVPGFWTNSRSAFHSNPPSYDSIYPQ